MRRRTAKFLAAAVALEFCLAIPLAASPTSDAFAYGGRGGGGHFGGGHFGGFHFGGGHFGGMHFGGMHFGGHHFGGMHYGARHFGGRHFVGRGAFGHHRVVSTINRVRTGQAFNHIGRNAFGGQRAWGAWNRGYGGYGYGWNAWYGPVFWPYFYGDILSFVLWPDAFYDPFFGYGADYFLSSIFAPGLWLGSDYAYGWGGSGPLDIYGYAENGGKRQQKMASRAAQETVGNASSSCAALAPGVSDLPFDKIEKAIDPTDTQAATLNDLKAASAEANNVLLASCPSEVPLTPISRIDAVGKRIDATIQAVQILRAPLTTLYNSLDDQQKERFDAIALREHTRKRSSKEAASTDDIGALCQQQAEDFTNLPVQRIEQTIKPTDQQVQALTALKDASAKAANNIEAACPSTMPQALTDRFDVIVKRLDAMAGAVNIVRPALKDFYGSLSDEQKARFNLMAPSNSGTQSTQRG